MCLKNGIMSMAYTIKISGIFFLLFMIIRPSNNAAYALFRCSATPKEYNTQQKMWSQPDKNSPQTMHLITQEYLLKPCLAVTNCGGGCAEKADLEGAEKIAWENTLWFIAMWFVIVKNNITIGYLPRRDVFVTCRGF